MGNSFGANGFSIGSGRHVSSSRYPKSVLHEGHEPDTVPDLRDTDALSREYVTEVDLAAAEADAATAGHHDGLIAERVLRATKDVLPVGRGYRLPA